jgi:hypothetical protein
MVKRGILSLSDIAPERFDFKVFVQTEWVIALDEIWELLSRDPPLVWVVTIRELPEEREQREFLHFLHSIKSSLGGDLPLELS